MLNRLRRFVGVDPTPRGAEKHVGLPLGLPDVERKLALLSDRDVLDSAKRALYDTGKCLDDYARVPGGQDPGEVLMGAYSNAQILVLALDHLSKR